MIFFALSIILAKLLKRLITYSKKIYFDLKFISLIYINELIIDLIRNYIYPLKSIIFLLLIV